MNGPRFDDSLLEFVNVVESTWGTKAVTQNLFMRDPNGRLTLIVLDKSKSKAKRASLGKVAAEALGAYVEQAEYAVATPEELFDDSLRDAAEARQIWVIAKTFSGYVRLVDRRAVGFDWLQVPGPILERPTRIVFSSLKGGVGRSTALCVLASHFAGKGFRVLTIDLDLEAPGLGNLLLSPETLPELGLLDFLVEKNLGNFSDDSYVELIGSSWLGEGRGRVDVIPAIGKKTVSRPENALSKIGRAYLATENIAGERVSFTSHIRELVEKAAPKNAYDVILIDSRAGLHETTAAALLGLGAEILLFGTNHLQTQIGFKLLFSHLAQTPASTGKWSERLRIVHAKATISESDADEFKSSVEQIFEESFYPNRLEYTPDLKALGESFETTWDDSVNDLDTDDRLPQVLRIREDEVFRTSSPEREPSMLNSDIYESAFSQLISFADELVAPIFGVR